MTFYIAYAFIGEAKSTDEMRCPTWFDIDHIPYDEMLPADRDFLPQIIANIEQKSKSIITGKLIFSKDMSLVLNSEYKHN